MTQNRGLAYEPFEPSWTVGPFFPLAVGVAWALFVLIDMAAFLLFPTQTLAMAIVPVITVCVTFVLHEWLHALVGWWYGCQVSFGIDIKRRDLTPYVVSAGTKTRNEQLVISLAPLVVLNEVALVVIALSVPFSMVWFLGVVVFATNTFGSIQGVDSDIATVYRLWQLPSTIRIRDRKGQPRRFLRVKTDD
ncbi:DUF3267 domain-containing protein [Haladaptatus sp. DYF46]|uniref:DUF3267 domain-containing protein n=1 Tax=Haladaptatus sp. DYF46 TaxID=2886041 RepID=UPI001E57EFCE|nr:DUF3267 domain-containing protein [Haladaptatus sp. DYF46]